MSFAIVAVLVLPVRLNGTGVVDPTIGPTSASDASVSPAERQTENAFMARQRIPATSNDDAEAAAGAASTSLIRYPDNERPKQKEVDPAQSTGRPAQAI
jgi:hypothetical protein